MLDMKLDASGDLVLTEDGDIVLTESICQAIQIRLKWIFKEWRLGPDKGFPWFEQVFVKNPNLNYVKLLLVEEILKVEGVESAKINKLDYNKEKRTLRISYTVNTTEETFQKEVLFNG